MENIRKTTKKAEKKEEISAEEQFYFTKLFSQRDGFKKYHVKIQKRDCSKH